MQLTIYELVILNSMNIKVYRYQSDNRKEVENKIEELKDDSGEEYKVLTYGVISAVGEYTEIPDDLEMKLQVEKLKLNSAKKIRNKPLSLLVERGSSFIKSNIIVLF
ncbi:MULTISPECIES: hypothetical protein [unclassified Staphylococcus]|uniref:hypothetical protein n=1 Tax=unclassified Staphylococcus TaxID=91994 RepID=UPI001AEBB96A|nr:MULTISPECIES: hypothetical protein [unclassified Staphylococcus]